MFRCGNWRACFRKYAGAVALTLLVVAGRLVMNPVWGEQSNRHLVFLPSTMVVTWFWGFGPGVLAAALATVSISYFWTAPLHHSFNVTSDLVLFFAVAVVIARLITSLRAASQRADRAAQAREQVLAVVAHDLRNPLSAIKLNVQALRAKVLEGTGPRQLATVERAAIRMERLISDLVDATRLEQGGLDLAVGDEPVDGIVNEAVELFAAQAREKGLSLESSAAADRSTVRCDRSRLLQVLSNLLANALRFTPAGGKVSLRAGPSGNGVRFEVADTGPGIDAENLPHVFERYWHADRKGAGLGLFIAQSLVRAQGGKIEIDSAPGLGARFFFTLPRTA